MNLVRISFSKQSLEIGLFLNVWVILITFAVLIVWLLYRRWRLSGWGQSEYEIEESEIGLGPGKVKLKPNYEDRQIAYKLWVEMNTRKIGQKIDFEHDVIAEIYNSWYEFFGITRELIGDIPVQKVRENDGTKKIVELSCGLLNEGLRPHLTKWQAKFRKWWSKAKEEKNKTPQEIQKDFEDWEELKRDMQEVNEKLINYKEKMEEVSLN
jgi:hypothetical protein